MRCVAAPGGREEPLDPAPGTNSKQRTGRRQVSLVNQPPRFFSPAETARRLKVSTKALRLYEGLGLVRRCAPARDGAPTGPTRWSACTRCCLEIPRPAAEADRGASRRPARRPRCGLAVAGSRLSRSHGGRRAPARVAGGGAAAVGRRRNLVGRRPHPPHTGDCHDRPDRGRLALCICVSTTRRGPPPTSAPCSAGPLPRAPPGPALVAHGGGFCRPSLVARPHRGSFGAPGAARVRSRPIRMRRWRARCRWEAPASRPKRRPMTKACRSPFAPAFRTPANDRATGELGVAVALVDDTAKAKAFYGALFGDGFHQIGPQDRWWSTRAAFGLFSNALGEAYPPRREPGDAPEVNVFVCVATWSRTRTASSRSAAASSPRARWAPTRSAPAGTTRARASTCGATRPAREGRAKRVTPARRRPLRFGG